MTFTDIPSVKDKKTLFDQYCVERGAEIMKERAEGKTVFLNFISCRLLANSGIVIQIGLYGSHGLFSES